MNLIFRLTRGPAGRRAVIAAAVLGLLAVSVSAAEGGMRRPAGEHQARIPGQPAEAVPGRGGCHAVAAGMRLLHQAARAARRVSYQGVQVISWRAPGGSGAWLGSGASQVTVDVWHRYGVGTLTRVTALSRSWSGVDRAPVSRQPTGMLGLTPALIGLLCAHYAVRPDGMGSADGRQARIVEAFRGNGSLAARFWLDSATKLPLRRELFDPEARLISDDDFVGLTLGARSASQAFLGHPASSSSAVPQPAASRPWAGPLGPAQLATLRAGGWPVPGPLPGGLTLFDASQSATATGRVVDLAYSDGLSMVSLFVQRGRLPAALAGWHQTDLSGNRLYVANPGEPDLTWSAGGFVYTVVAGAPAPTVAAAVNALPHQAGLGFWGRMRRGLHRLWSWINPFG